MSDATTTQLPFALLRPLRAEVASRPDVEPEAIVPASELDWDSLWSALQSATAIALDWETRGTATWRDDTTAVGLAVAWTSAPRDRWDGEWATDYLYIELTSESEAVQAVDLFLAACGLAATGPVDVVCHNALFDLGIARMHWLRSGGRTSHTVRPSHCTLVGYKQLASEGWPGQRHGLKSAMVDVLGWDDANDGPVADWLIARGHHTNGPRLREGESPDEHLARVREWEATPTKSGGARPSVKADRGEMWRVPASILGHYSALDAVATLQLHCRVLAPVWAEFPEFEQFHRVHYMHLVSMLVDQTRVGIRLDLDALEKCAEMQSAAMAAAEATLRAHPGLGAHIARWESARLEPLVASQPPQFLVRRLGAEPPRLTKAGVESKTWLKWAARRDAPPVQSKTWEKWRERVAKAPRFSLSSGPELRAYLYGEGGPLKWEWGAEPNPSRRKRGTVWIEGRYGRVELERTQSGLQPIDVKAIEQLADDSLREPLRQWMRAFKIQQFVASYRELAHVAADGTTRIHPGWKAHGTKTGRLSGAEPNLQQIPKDLHFLDCMVADEGWVWIEWDWPALEPHVLADFSRDPGLLALYGPDANPNHDRYLFSAFDYPGALGAKIRSVYRRDTPTAESTAHAKRDAKKEREVAKHVVLSGDYGAGAPKVHRSLIAKGVQGITLRDAEAMVQAHRETYRGVYFDFGPRLERELKARGYFVSGLGFPVPVWRERAKDVVNRCIQSSGHNLHVIAVSHWTAALDAAGVEYRDVVVDFHDQAIRAVRPADVELALRELRVAAQRAVTECLAVVHMELDPRVVHSMSEAKAEEAFNKRVVQRQLEQQQEQKQPE